LLYNTTHRVTKSIASPSQEEIYNCPEYFALSYDEILKSKTCPEFLKKILDEFPWDGRPNVLQVRPQDFRVKRPELLGDNMHTDIMVRLNDGNVRVARNSHEFHLMVCSWGGVTGTDFIKTPMEMRDIFDGVKPEFTPMDLLNTVHATPFDVVTSKEGELIEYTSRDIHRMHPNYRLGNFRLMIVAFDTDTVVAGGMVLPSIKEKQDPNANHPQFKDYVR
jgi:hypothetical protein